MSSQARYFYKTIIAAKEGAFLDEQLTPFPPSVAPEDMFDYLVDIYGDPTDQAVTQTDEFGKTVIEWVFDDPSSDRSDPPRELVVLPMIEDPDDPILVPVASVIVDGDVQGHVEHERNALCGAGPC